MKLIGSSERSSFEIWMTWPSVLQGARARSELLTALKEPKEKEIVYNDGEQGRQQKEI